MWRRHLCVWDGQAVLQGWTYVRVAATNQLCAGRGHLCVSCKQLLSARGGQMSLPAALQVYITSLQNYTNCTKIFKKFFIFWLFCELTFLKFYDIIFIENKNER